MADIQQNLLDVNNSKNQNKPWFPCLLCGKSYQARRSLWRHCKYECGKEAAFGCPYCDHRTKLKSNLQKHMVYKHLKW